MPTPTAFAHGQRSWRSHTSGKRPGGRHSPHGWAGPINTLAAAGLLDLLVAPPNTEIVIIRSVLNEIITRAPEFSQFIEINESRVQIVNTSVCNDDAAKLARGDTIGKRRGDLAIADFLMNFIDDTVGNSPAVVIFEDKKLGRLRAIEQFSENAHFITTAAYLRKLEQEGIIASFSETWQFLIDKNSSEDPKLHREPNPVEIDAPARNGSSVFRMR